VKNKLKVLDLFSGLGGFSLGLERTGHFKTVAFCDNNKYSKLVIDKHWKGIKIYDDIKEITKEKFTTDGIEAPDIITGGVPCQPFSVAGKQKGTSDDRYLWPEMFRIIKAFKSKFVIVENVRGIVNIENGMVFETVCSDLESEGYEVQAFNIPAAGVGAPHRRERIWFIAVREDATNTESKRTWKDNGGIRQGSSRISGGQGTTAAESPRSNVANTIGEYEGREISRSDEEKRRIQEEHRTEHSTTRKSSRTSEVRNGDNGYENMENSNNNGLEGRLTETRNETITGKESTFNGSEDSNNSSRRSDGGGDQSKSRIDGAVQGLRDGNEEELTRTTGVRGVREGTNISVGTIRENKNQEDDNRTLVQTRQSGVQSSVSGGLELNQTSLDDNQIRQGDDNSSFNRMEKGNKDNVADTESIGSDVRGREQHQGERSGQGEIGGASSSNVADTIGERGRSRITERENAEDVRQSPESSNTGWWHVEPNVGRVAHGVSGRVHRLKGLGNSIVPQIVEEIGKALIKAERTD